jgi:Tol biopolymer transport system component
MIVASPTAAPSILPTPIVTSIPETTGPLPAGAKIVYSESNGTSITSTIWIASATNPLLRKRLITVTNRPGYGPQGAVSPDGSKIAFLVIPPDASEQTARFVGGDLWLMNSDGTNARRLINPVKYFAGWAPTNQQFAIGRLSSVSDTLSSEPGTRTELYAVSLSTPTPRILFSSELGEDVYPVGWSKDGKRFFYTTRASLTSKWKLWQVNIHDKARQLLMEAPTDSADLATLSPDGQYVAFWVEGDPRQLTVTSLTGELQKTVVSEAGSASSELLYTGGIWSSDSNEVAIYYQPQNGAPPILSRKSVDPAQQADIAQVTLSQPLLKDEFLTPVYWSPDKKWIVLQKYPSGNIFYFTSMNGDAPQQLLPSRPDNWIMPLGWIGK